MLDLARWDWSRDWPYLAGALVVLASAVLIERARRRAVAERARVAALPEEARKALESDRAATRDRRGRRVEDLLTAGVAAAAAGLSAAQLGKFGRDVMGLTGPWAYLPFVALDFAAVVCALRARRRASRGAAAGLSGALVWVLALLSASMSASEGAGLGEMFALGIWAPIAAVLWELGLAEERHARTARADRRVGWIRWLHPIERVLVLAELASDEHLGAADATERVRERRAARALYRLRQATEARDARAGTGGASARSVRGIDRRYRRAEAFAQRTASRVRLADAEVEAAVLPQLRVLVDVGRLATMTWPAPGAADPRVGEAAPTPRMPRPRVGDTDAGAGTSAGVGAGAVPPNGDGRHDDLGHGSAVVTAGGPFRHEVGDDRWRVGAVAVAGPGRLRREGGMYASLDSGHPDMGHPDAGHPDAGASTGVAVSGVVGGSDVRGVASRGDAHVPREVPAGGATASGIHGRLAGLPGEVDDRMPVPSVVVSGIAVSGGVSDEVSAGRVAGRVAASDMRRRPTGVADVVVPSAGYEVAGHDAPAGRAITPDIHRQPADADDDAAVRDAPMAEWLGADVMVSGGVVSGGFVPDGLVSGGLVSGGLVSGAADTRRDVVTGWPTDGEGGHGVSGTPHGASDIRRPPAGGGPVSAWPEEAGGQVPVSGAADADADAVVVSPGGVGARRHVVADWPEGTEVRRGGAGAGGLRDATVAWAEAAGGGRDGGVVSPDPSVGATKGAGSRGASRAPAEGDLHHHTSAAIAADVTDMRHRGAAGAPGEAHSPRDDASAVRGRRGADTAPRSDARRGSTRADAARDADSDTARRRAATRPTVSDVAPADVPLPNTISEQRAAEGTGANRRSAVAVADVDAAPSDNASPAVEAPPAYDFPRQGHAVDGTPLTSAARRDPRILGLVALLAAEADVTGAEVGRRLGVSSRTGQRLLGLAQDELDARRNHADDPELGDAGI
ncbi:hypothetical protein [Embleya hyalina]|uniref:DUF2637 domain-containing protein n=1 Tax=Embleya hyalina TaxID=516124 RepID=A0A401YJB5_9ACTN|nr:hypothetical protein [Embleya hyalina]GCD94714.1 hypothetical protein EHYA_02383 [Embleya hyalina]